ncbi:MAG: glycosyltransferase family 4 protein [Cyclobacteriaceae bacterium]|nr:glycosyltransferase family 4 protein [Cyclobacteriaceae bacterium]
MKVAIVINTSWNIYNFRQGLIKSFLDKNYEVVAIAPSDDYSSKLEELGCTFVPLTMDSRGANPVRDFRLIVEFIKIYKKVRPDLVLHYTIKPNIYGAMAAAYLGIPVINNVSGLGTIFLNNGFSSHVARLLYRFAFRFPKVVFFQNHHDRDLFLNLKLVDEQKTRLLPGSGVNPAHFKPSLPTAENGREFTFLMISRLIKDKGIHEYITAAALIKSKGLTVRFQILGALDPRHSRGISEQEFQTLIRDAGVEYLGNEVDVRPFISSADCVVLPSYREGTPRTLLESASMGKPLIATNVPGCNAVVKNEFNGYLCEVKNAESLANCMVRILNTDLQERRSMGQNSRRLILEQFDERFVISRYHQAINDIFQRTNTSSQKPINQDSWK